MIFEIQESDTQNIITIRDLNLNKSDLNSGTPCSIPLISEVKFDESVATFRSHNVSNKYKAKLMPEMEETCLKTHSTWR